MMRQIHLSQIPGFLVGHAQDIDNATGCTAILCKDGALAGVDVRGGSPASRETELLRPENTVQQIHCVMLSGGSAYGLEAGDGAMAFLEEQGIGFDVGIGRVPIVCGASLFDLELVSAKRRPDKAMGYAACQNAWRGGEPAQGNVGAGTGATVGKFYNTERMMKCGIGIWAGQIGDVQCGAIVAVNALGDVVDWESGRILAGLLNEDRTGFADTRRCMYQELQKSRNLWSGNTTIGCVITNARLDKCQCRKAAVIAHDGYAQSIRPAHCTVDGDTLFVMASGQVEVAPDSFYAMASEAVARAVKQAALTAAPAYGLKAAADFL